MSFGHGSLLLGNARALWSHLGVQVLVARPLFRQVISVENRCHRALRNTGLAIDALLRVNEEDRFAFVKTLDRTNNDAVGVLAVETGFSNNMCHGNDLSHQNL